MHTIQIRDARPSDREAIEAVTLLAYQEYSLLMPNHWDAYRESIVATLADVRPAQQIVAEQQDRIIATVLLYPVGLGVTAAAETPDTAPEVRLLAVHPEARGSGVGAALMNECIRRARQSGATALHLHTSDVMRAGIRLYERMGFHRAADLDFQLGPELRIKGYRLGLVGTSAGQVTKEG